MRKKILIVLIIIIIISMQISSMAAEKNQGIIILEKNKNETIVLIEDSYTFFPLRLICERLGYKVDWSSIDSQIHISNSDKEIIVDLKNNKVTAKNGHSYYDYIKLVNQKTYMDKDFFEENFGIYIINDNVNEQVIIKSFVQNQIEIINSYETSSNKVMDITLNYPQINGSLDINVLNKINSFFKQMAMDVKERGIKNADEMQKEILEYPTQTNKWATYFDYKIKYNQNGLLSFILLDYQYLGGAHGSTIQSSYTFDLKTGEQIELKDLLKSDSEYISAFNKIVKCEIDKRELYLLTPFESIKEDQVYYLTNEGVSIYFQQYEYFPYAAGIQVFTADYASLKEMLNEKYSFLIKTNN